jgi:nitroreductase
MELNHALFGRRSVREYTPQPVDEKAVRQLIEAATYAPNALNRQPWTFTVVRDQSLLERLSDDAKTDLLANMPEGEHSDHIRSMLEDPSFRSSTTHPY